ncbi:MAG TPA: DNA repair protein RecO [Gemmatimonadales bacterium]|jgi:DNA repair protein RecO (recombination protein O)|nr:DNA repair protein RecO [Gemmatimonadales bacterium]
MLVSTPAVVLQTFRYSETSKIVRLATRDFGVQSAIAKGVLRPKSPFGAGLETLSEGVAQLYHRETRELQTLAAFDVLELRRGLARDLGRFAGAAVLAEVMLKMAPAAALPAAYAALTQGLDALAAATPAQADPVAARWLWLLVGVLGFAPQLDACVRDGTPVAGNGRQAVAFSAAEGGVLCARCGGGEPPPPTRLPAEAYHDLLALNDASAALPVWDAPHAAAHRRLVARFVRHHLGESGPVPALDFWERRAWVTPAAS